MSPSRRRALLFGLLLLAPTLAVGTSALWLLRREQARITAQAAAVESRRHAAVIERTSLIAESMAVLVEDLRTTLGQTLATMPRSGERAFLEGLRYSNPFVGDVFASDAAGRVRWGATTRATTDWLREGEVADEVEAAAARRQVEARKDAQAEESGRQMERQAQKQAALNVDNYARNRAELREAASAKLELADLAAPSPAVAAKARLSTEEADGAVAPRREVRWGVSVRGVEGGLFAWVEAEAGGRVGLAVNLPALREQLTGVLPTEVPAGESYALMRVEAGAPEVASADAVVPVSDQWLPGWQVVGSRWAEPASRSNGTGALLAGGAMVILLAGAILVGGVLLVRDARRSEIEAQQKTSFVANISHEFKTPLTSIRLYAELLEQGRVQGAEKQRDCLGVIGRETARLTRLVNNALDFGRLEQGKKTFDLRPIDLAAEVENLLAIHAPRIEAAGLRLERGETPTEGLSVTADRDALHQIVLNLIDNACKYAAAGGELWYALTTGEGGRGATVRVADRGPGVPAKERERIFQKFTRLDETLTAEQSGTGLGLSLARQLARGMGGELRCEAREGGGAVFILTLR